MDEARARADLAEVCRLAYARGYICATEGNFSIRLAPDRILSTPRGVCKGRLTPEELIVTTENGELLGGGSGSGQRSGRPSTELGMHLTAYMERPDIGAVAHCHPTVAVGFTVAGLSLSRCVLPEAVCTLGHIPTAPYATPSTAEVSEGIRGLVRESDALMLDHHGALTVGKDIWDAFYKMETLEHHAQTMLVAHLLGGVKPLSSSQVQKLLDVRHVYGLTRPLPADILTGPECSCPDSERKS